MSYSTGEIAELCGVTVRTVQYYDREGLLKPEGFSEGGRRLYSEDSLKTLQIICMYKQLGLSLSDIKSVLAEQDNGAEILIRILNEREKSLDEEIKQKLSCRDSVRVIKKHLSEGSAMSRNTFFDIRTIMEGRKKQVWTYVSMGVVGLLTDASIITTIVLWATMGLWIPFAAVMPCAIALTALIVWVAYKNLAYICCECGKKFRPKFSEFFFGKHTFRTRKCTCTHCGAKKFHTETYSD